MTLPLIPQIPKSLDNLADQTVNPAAKGFVKWVLVKLGISEEILKAKDRVAANKVIKRAELELPYFIAFEAKKLERQYSNLGVVLHDMAPMITAEKPEIKDDNDFFWGLLEHSKEISNEEIQTLISKILAGEYNKPGTYSMSTLQSLKSLGRKELELFEKICSLLVDGSQLPHAIFTGQDSAKALNQKLGIDFGRLQLLQSVGLFLPNNMTRSISNEERKKFLVSYFDKKLIFEPENNNLDIKIPGFYGLSIAGEQILDHVNPKYSEDFYIWLKENYKINNYKITEAT